VAARLAPAGLMAGAEPEQRRAAAPSPLAITLNAAVVGPEAIARATGVLRHLYAPPLLVPLLAAVAAAHAWLYGAHGVVRGADAVFGTPGAFLVVLGLVLASTAFHELGHAAALHYGGGRARAIGAGLYLVYPAFYTDVTDCYRLGRWARVRTDLGGFYFNLLFALAMVGAYAATGWEVLLVVVVVTDLEILHQLLPFVRLDGYWLLADLTGVPDFFSQMGSFVRSLLPVGRSRGGRLPALRWWAKAVFGLYVVVVVPWLLVSLALLVAGAPHFLSTTADALRAAAAEARRAGDTVAVAAALVRTLLLVLPVLGLGLLLANLVRGLARAAVSAPKRFTGGCSDVS
jgi:putative peptide zinc metalloprotease protein